MTIKHQENQIQIGNTFIPFQVGQGKPDRIRISFREKETLLIETGNGQLGKRDLDFLESKSRWILRTWSARRSDWENREHFLNNLEARIPVLGKETPIEYRISRKTHFRLKPGSHFIIFGPRHLIQNHKKKMIYFSMRKFAEQYLGQQVEKWKEVCGLEINQLRIKDVKSKWGSCSALRNINLNWHLVLLEENLINYLIVHELMHLHELNHSPEYWKWVARYDPDYKKHRKQLKEKSWLVGILK